ncbi:hypothetical protein C7G83_11600 [Siccibacter turicensis]|uniref:Uncharacterized protein n=2 Tax=Siccibacter turicensis TaxID=357233 RepID=A0A2P8VK12_9ENTR|nr:hypothetical protein C7G83_11600 [Siccibacter turicensis]
MQAAVLRVGDAVALRFDEAINGEIDIEEQKTDNTKICIYSNANFTETVTIRPSELCKYTRTVEEK